MFCQRTEYLLEDMAAVSFPILCLEYCWGYIIVGARYSAKLTKLFGNRAVSLLATMFLLSYTKLLQTITASMGFTTLKVFSTDNNYTLTVWSPDGHYTYCHFPHVLLFIACLLYTSPSPRDATLSRMPSSA